MKQTQDYGKNNDSKCGEGLDVLLFVISVI